MSKEDFNKLLKIGEDWEKMVYISFFTGFIVGIFVTIVCFNLWM